jgi:large subunit ribosomal protein L9
MGDVVCVKSGFARNFLLPKKIAIRATTENLKEFNKRKAQLEAENLKCRDEANKVAKKMENLSLAVIRQASEGGSLYGSVTVLDLAEAITENGFIIAKQQVLLEKPIKTIGLHTARIVLHPEVIITIQINVALSPEEAAAQLEDFNKENIEETEKEKIENK